MALVCLFLILSSARWYTDFTEAELYGLEETSDYHPILLLRQVPKSRLHRKVSRRVFDMFGEGDPTASLGSLFQCFVALKWAFPHVSVELPTFQFVLLAPCFVTGHQKKRV